jgi:tetratricopeptide (TPR) repeat protein
MTTEETTAAAYQRLDEDAQWLYRLLGAAHPGVDVTVPAAAVLADITPDAAERALVGMATHRLASVTGPMKGTAHTRYALTEQARAHAQAIGVDDADELGGGLRRLTEWYRQVSVAVEIASNPGRWHLGPGYDSEPIIAFGSRRAALAWVDVERPNLQAVVQAAYDAATAGDAGMAAAAAWTIEGLWSWYTQRRAASDCITDHTLMYEAAALAGDPQLQARALEGRAWGYVTAGNPGDALEDAKRARALERDADHPTGEAATLELMGQCHLQWDNPEVATALFVEARQMHLAGEPRLRGAYLVTRHLGEASRVAGRNLEAAGHFQEALAFFEQFPGEHYHRARALNGLGRVYMALHRIEDAQAAARSALAEAEQIDAANEKAISLVLLADLAADGDEEQRHLDAAAALVEGLEGLEAERIRQRLPH